jgi:hypothetical protein
VSRKMLLKKRTICVGASVENKQEISTTVFDLTLNSDFSAVVERRALLNRKS